MNKEHLEIHYYFDDQSHSMEAEIYNKCSEQIVIIFKEIAQILDIKINIEIEGTKEGGLREFFTVIYKNVSQPLPAGIIPVIIIFIITYDPKDTQLKDLDIEIKKEQLNKEKIPLNSLKKAEEKIWQTPKKQN